MKILFRACIAAVTAGALLAQTAFAGAFIPANPANSRINTQNITPAAFQNTRIALGKSLNGTSRMKACWDGDSTTAGTGSSAATIQTSPPTYALKGMKRAGIPARADGSYAWQYASDARWSVGSGWSAYSNSLLTNNSTTNAATLTATGIDGSADSIDTVDVYYYDNTNGAQFTITVNGGTATTITQTGSNALKKATVTFTAGTSPTIAIARVSGTIYIAYVDPYLSTSTDVDVLNLGSSGSTTSNWNGGVANVWSPDHLAAFVGCSLHVINLTTNDANNGVAVSTAQTNLQAFVTELKGAATPSDIVIVNPEQTGGPTVATQLSYYGMLQGIAASNGLPWLSLYDRFPNYSAAFSAGLMDNSLHPSIVGNNDVARFEVNAILGIVGR